MLFIGEMLIYPGLPCFPPRKRHFRTITRWQSCMHQSRYKVALRASAHSYRIVGALQARMVHGSRHGNACGHHATATHCSVST